MSGVVVDWALRRRGLSPQRKFILTLLADSANPDGEVIMDRRVLSDLAEVAVPELSVELGALEGLGIIVPWGALDDEAIALTTVRYTLAIDNL